MGDDITDAKPFSVDDVIESFPGDNVSESDILELDKNLVAKIENRPSQESEESLSAVHDTLWEINPERGYLGNDNKRARELSSLSSIVEKDISYLKNDDGEINHSTYGPVGNCLGLSMEMVAIAAMRGIEATPLHLRGISESHMGVVIGAERTYVDPTLEGGYDIDISRGAMSKAVPVNNKQVASLYKNNVATTIISEGRYEEAHDILSEGIKDYPESPELSYTMARCLSYMGEDDDAEGLLESLKDGYSHDPALHYKIADIRLNKDMYHESANMFAAIISAYPFFLPAYTKIAESLEGLSREEEAIPYLMAAMDIEPSYNPARKKFYEIMRS